MATYPSALTEEVLAQLGAPVPASEIKTLPGGMKYTTDKWAKSRFDAVVGHAGWGDKYVVTHLSKPVVMHEGLKDESLIIGTIVCEMNVLGVVKSDVADIEITPKMYGTPATNGKARAFKRTARLYRVAEELWEKDVPTAVFNTDGGPSNAAPAGETKPVSSGQLSWLTGSMKVPEAVAKQLTGGRGGQASALIEILKPAQGNDDYAVKSAGLIVRALTEIGRADLVPLVSTKVTQAQQDSDDDED